MRMGFYLQVSVNSSLSTGEFHDRVIAPLSDLLTKQQLGRVLDPDDVTADSDGRYELALEVVDQTRARSMVEAFLESIDA